MQPIEFKEQNAVFGKGQPEYLPLPAFINHQPSGEVITCWRLSLKERIRLLFTGKLWASQLTFHKSLQPQLFTTKKYDLFVYEHDHQSENYKNLLKQEIGPG